MFTCPKFLTPSSGITKEVNKYQLVTLSKKKKKQLPTSYFPLWWPEFNPDLAYMMHSSYQLVIKITLNVMNYTKNEDVNK